MKHPFQNVMASSTHLYTTVKNNLYVVDLSSGSVVGSWSDPINSETTENAPKKAKTNSKKKAPKGMSGTTLIFNQIRCVQVIEDKFVAVTTDSDKSVVIFSLDFTADNCLSVLKRQTMPKRPCSLTYTDEGKSVIIGDKFGDVYRIAVDDNVVPEKDLVPILGHVSMLTKVLACKVDDVQYLLTSDRDEHIKVSQYPKSYIVNHWLFGHDEYISDMVVHQNDPKLLVSAGGDDSVFLWDWFNNKLLSSYDMREQVQQYLTDYHYPAERFRTEDSVKEISVVKLAVIDNIVVVLLENVKALVLLNIADNKLEFNSVFPLEYPLVDITAYENTIVGVADTTDDKLVQFFQLQDAKLSEDTTKNDIITKLIETNTSDVVSRDDFYQLYTASSLRKRSEH